MRQPRKTAARLRLAPWAVAGAVILGTIASISAQDATPAPVAVEPRGHEFARELPATASGTEGQSAPSAMPATGVGLATGGTVPMALDGMVGASVAAVVALRERFKERG